MSKILHKIITFIFPIFFGRFSLNIATVDGLTVSLPSEIDFYLRDLSSSMFLPCNIKRAQEFYSKYGDDESNEAIVFRKRGKHVLQIAKTILDNLGVRFWLSSGTCLGEYEKGIKKELKKHTYNSQMPLCTGINVNKYIPKVTR